jgi:hypothetical protein
VLTLFGMFLHPLLGLALAGGSAVVLKPWLHRLTMLGVALLLVAFVLLLTPIFQN